jgi:hypothetical protein
MGCWKNATRIFVGAGGLSWTWVRILSRVDLEKLIAASSRNRDRQVRIRR